MKKRTTRLIIAAVCLTAVFLAAALYTADKHDFYRDRGFGSYLKQLGVEQSNASGNDVIRLLGEPADTLYQYYEDGSEQKVSYITLIYDSCEFGINGAKLENRVTALKIKQPGTVHLRDKVDIGTERREADRAYLYEKKSSEEYGFFLGDEHEIQDGGGTRIFFELDNDERISQIIITDGL